MRGDTESANLAIHQLEWIAGRNPFSQSTMFGEGYDFAPLYTPSSGDIAGALPVGIQTRAESDVPYWPVQSTWTYKEVWVHPVSQWIGIVRDIKSPAVARGKTDNSLRFEVSENSTSNGEVTITVRVQGSGSHKLSIRTSNLKIKDPAKPVNLKPGKSTTLVWHAKTESVDELWIAVIIADNDLASHKELFGRGLN